MGPKKLFSLFLLIAILIGLFYLMWAISRYYPLELSLRVQSWAVT